MTEPAPGGGTKLAAAVDAAEHFLDLLTLGRDRAALVTFDLDGRILVGLTADRAALSGAMASLSTAQGTRIDRGLEAAGSALAAARPEARPVVVLLTDGIQSAGTPQDVLDAAAAVKAAGALVYTIGLGANVQPELLKQVASSDDRYFESPTVADLAEIYRQISERLACEGSG
jgi:Ca-activated chloride channel family protein